MTLLQAHQIWTKAADKADKADQAVGSGPRPPSPILVEAARAARVAEKEAAAIMDKLNGDPSAPQDSRKEWEREGRESIRIGHDF